MISKETLFNTLFEENLVTDPKLIKLNQEILDLENQFQEKYGNEVFMDYCKINELILDELLECADFSFKSGFALREYLKNSN